MRAAWLFLAASLAACSGSTSLAPIPPADRVTISELENLDPRAELREPAVVTQALSLANELRGGAWSPLQGAITACGTYRLTFTSQGKPVGFLGLDGERFVTNGTSGPVQRPAAKPSLDAFRTLLPPRYETSKCMG